MVPLHDSIFDSTAPVDLRQTRLPNRSLDSLRCAGRRCTLRFNCFEKLVTRVAKSSRAKRCSREVRSGRPIGQDRGIKWLKFQKTDQKQPPCAISLDEGTASNHGFTRTTAHQRHLFHTKVHCVIRSLQTNNFIRMCLDSCFPAC